MADPGLARAYLSSFRRWAAACETLAAGVWSLAELLSQVLRNGGGVLLCGNGGSAADAQHFAGEMVGRFAEERRPYNVTALTANAPVLTAIANDYGADGIFARQVRAVAKPGDCLIVISTSGSSPNVLSALRAGRAEGCLNVALVGPDGLPGGFDPYADMVVSVPRPRCDPDGGDGLRTPHVQEVHHAVLHCLAFLVEKALSEGSGRLSRPKRPAVFLDRDGTLIAPRGYITDPDEVELLPGAAEAVRLLNRSAVAAVVTTNQSAVARGLVGEARLGEIHDRLQELLRREGAGLDGVYHCPHHPLFPRPGGTCPCRKPLPGMILAAAADLDLDLEHSACVGDSWDDVRAGIASGGRGILVLAASGGREGPPEDRSGAPGPVAPEAQARCAVAADVLSAVRMQLDRLAVSAAGAGLGAGGGPK